MRNSNGVGTQAGSSGERLLQAVFGTRDRAQRFYDTQMLDHLNGTMREFIGRQEMVFAATADRAGNCDVTFRAGPPGFVAVLDERRVAWPEYRGNGVLASLGNISENGHAGLLFVDFFQDLIGLHVNGRAAIVEDRQMRRAHPFLPVDVTPGRQADRWVRIDVHEAYIHCRKHIPRLMKMPRERSWGADGARAKGGDFFGVGRERSAPPDVLPGVVRPRRWWQGLIAGGRGTR